jgi:hypothetical protein
MLIVAALTVAGVALRLAVAHQSLAADELSTRWIVAGHGLGDVLSIVRTDAEITPPLSFVAAWLTTRIEVSPELLRAPAVIAGALTIPLVFAVGVRTVGRRAALVATALTAFSPFMIFYSAEARGYGLMILLVLASTFALLIAVEDGRTRWWVAYGACACAAAYTHYTSVFALAGQLLWLVWAHPQARRPALTASIAAAVAFVPWLPGLKADLDSATTDILSALQPFSAGHIRTSLAHWAVGYPYALPGTGVADLPGTPALVAFALALALGLAALAAKLARGRSPIRLDRRVVLVLVLAVSVPTGEALTSLLGSNLFGTRNLAASWPGLALSLGALLAGAGRRLGPLAAALAIAAFALGAARMLDPDFQRPDYEGVAAFIEREARPGDVIVDGAIVSPAGIPTALDTTFHGRNTVFQLGQSDVRYDPFRILGFAPPTAEVMRSAVAAAGRHRLLLIVATRSPAVREPIDALPDGYRRVATARFPGSNPMAVLVYEDQTAMGA